MASRIPNSEAVPKGPSTSGSNTAPSIKQQQNPKIQQNPRQQQQQQQRPVGNNADGTTPSGALAKKNPKEMTKAERRELQERQRAAKAAATANASAGGGPGGKGGTKPTPGGNNASPSQTSSRRRSIVGAGAPPDTPSRSSHAHAHAAGADDTSAEAARGLRIFSHFGTPKPVSSKGSDVDRRAIHPAIIRLGLQFSGFKITGANARCIATLAAFKTVRIS